MATQSQIDATYNYMDEVWRVCVGDQADISGAMYDGDHSLSLEQAQLRKHEFILRETGFVTGDRVLDIGCGWGAFLKTVRAKGGRCVGLTLSSKQARHCARRGLDVRLQDWKTLDPGTLGSVNIIASMGAFEHFCSDTEYVAGKQDAVYGRYFALCRDLLPNSATMFLQTMTWDRYIPDPEKATVDAPDGSDDHVIGLLRKFYPGSWLPSGIDHIARVAAPYFEIVKVSSGRLDYIQTIDAWYERLRRRSLSKLVATLKTVPYALRDRDLRHKLESSRRKCNQECFKRGLMEHYRIVLKRT